MVRNFAGGQSDTADSRELAWIVQGSVTARLDNFTSNSRIKLKEKSSLNTLNRCTDYGNSERNRNQHRN